MKRQIQFSAVTSMSSVPPLPESASGNTVCEKCGGTGWILSQREQLSGVTQCECVLAERAAALEPLAGVPALYCNASLDNFVLPSDNPVARRQLANILLAVRSFAREYPNTSKPGLLFIGDPGTGKTHLAVAALRLLIAKGFEGLFCDYQDLLVRIRAGFDPASGTSEREAYQSTLDAEVLLLDDLGAHRVTDWVEDTVTGIITYRCNHKKTLIATTNLPDPDTGDAIIERRSSSVAGIVDYRVSLADKVGTRARSRLFEMCQVIHMPAVGDYRIKKKLQL